MSLCLDTLRDDNSKHGVFYLQFLVVLEVPVVPKETGVNDEMDSWE